ncbi:MAG: branched-chain amino acid transaminase [Anaerolineales bacterium]|nr:branched-chain amino acid transaminase [Anaerolineales bacterium]
MAIKNASEWVWLSGEFVPWDQATVHVSVHGLNYGSTVFEGIRAYETPDGPAIFRLADHMRRFMFSCKVARLDDGMIFTQEELEQACIELVDRNQHNACYIRPLAFRDSETLGLNGAGQKTQVTVYSVNWGRYLGEKGIDEGVDVAITSWRRVASSTMAKIGGQYINNQQISMEARRHGYAEGIALDAEGNISEGAGENLFLVIDGEIYTPPVAASILLGITRDSVVTIANDLGVTIHQQVMPREMLYMADEVFMTGTAAEITPIRSVDGIVVGAGKPGPVTKAIQKEFFGIVNGKIDDRYGWLTHVRQALPQAE